MTAEGWSAVIAGAVAVAAVLAWVGRLTWKLLRRILWFLEEWFGEPARPGVPARAGVMERLADQDEAIAEIRAETQPNGGSSMRDLVHKIAADVAGLLEWRAVIEQETQTTTQTTTIEVQPASAPPRPGTVVRRRT